MNAMLSNNTRHSWRTMIGLLAISSICLALVGCQTFKPKVSGELGILEHDFITIWDSYNSCMEATDIQEMTAHLQVLQSAPKPISLEDSPIPLPRFIKNLTTARNSRLSVDPRAMAASCSLHLAEVARQSADWDTAFSTFQSILKNYPEPQYAYYVIKANQGIESFALVLPISLSSEEALVR